MEILCVINHAFAHVALRSSDVTEETFRRELKTFLFNFLDSYVDSYRDIDSYVTILPSLPT